MDPKLKALATEYEKARKQNLQLRQALQSEKDKNKALSDEVEQLKNRPMLPTDNDGDITKNSQITRLQAELDQLNAGQASVIREKDETIQKLELEISKLKDLVSDPVETSEIGIQKDEESVSDIDKEQVYKEAISGMRLEIEKIKSDHQQELADIMQNKRLIQPDVIIPKELNIIDQSDLGTCESTTSDQLSSLTTFYQSQIQSYIVRLQNEIARAQYSSAESQAALARLRKADDERFSLIDELRESREETKNTQSELETIKRSYEEQLETMTEELAQQLNAVNTSTSNVVEEEKTTKKSRFSLFGRGT